MHGIAVTLLTEDKERLTVLQQRLESTQMGRNVFGHVGFPTSPTDAILRQIQDVRADVVLVDIDPQNVQRAMHAIELIHSNTSEIVIFAVGPMTDPGTIVSAMRAGAREYVERNATPESMIDAFTRFAASRGRTRTSSGRARVFVVANAKGGAGATTVAVNTAVALQELHGGVLLVDFALLGHAALHLNARPTFGLTDALQNLHRMDTSLLQGLMTTCKNGLQLLAGPQEPHQSHSDCCRTGSAFRFAGFTVSIRCGRLLQSHRSNGAAALRFVECRAVSGAVRCSFSVECWPAALLSGRRRRTRSGPSGA